MKKIVKVIGEVLENGSNYESYDTVSYRFALKGMVTARCMDCVDSESRMSTAKRLMEALSDYKST